MATETTNFFRKITFRFEQVPVDAEGNVSTKEFLEATKQLVTIFDELGSMAFSTIKSDMLGNVELIEKRYNANPTRMSTLQKVLLADKEDKITGRNATIGMVWLKRALEFVSASFQNALEKQNEELTVCFTNAYNATLSKHHTMFVRPVFSLAMNAVPYRKDFYSKLQGTTTVPELIEDMKLYFSPVVSVVGVLTKYFKDNNLDGLK